MLTFGTIALLKNAPHPNAGKLFLEYCLSEDGQKVTRDPDLSPAAFSLRSRGLKPCTVSFW